MVVAVKNQNYVAYDITGAQITFTVKENAYDVVLDTNAVIYKTVANSGISITDGSNGEAQISLTPSDTDPRQNSDLELGTYYYDVQVQIYGHVYTVVLGRITFTKQISIDEL